jgi:hypothetical protein
MVINYIVNFPSPAWTSHLYESSYTKCSFFTFRSLTLMFCSVIFQYCKQFLQRVGDNAAEA